MKIPVMVGQGLRTVQFEFVEGGAGDYELLREGSTYVLRMALYGHVRIDDQWYFWQGAQTVRLHPCAAHPQHQAHAQPPPAP